MTLVLLCTVAVWGSASVANAADIADEQRKAFEGIIHDYLGHHPEVVTEALQAAREEAQRQARAKAAQARAASRSLRRRRSGSGRDG